MVRLKTGTAVNPYAAAIGGAAVKGASRVYGTFSDAITADLVVIRTQTRPRGRHAPIEYELHLNPAAIGIGVVGAGLALWLMQLRMHPTVVAEMRTVVDVPAIPEQHIPEDGHWEATGTGIIKGPQGWSAGAKVWVVDRKAYTVPAVPAVTHQVPTGKMVKTYSVEQRRGFGDTSTGALTSTYESMPTWIKLAGAGGWYPIAKLLGL